MGIGIQLLLRVSSESGKVYLNAACYVCLLGWFSAPVTTADAGQCVSFALKRMRRTAVRKGMIIAAKTEFPPRGECIVVYCAHF